MRQARCRERRRSRETHQAEGGGGSGAATAEAGARDSAQDGEGDDDYRASTPRKADDAVICGAPGSPECNGQEKTLSDTDKLVLKDANALRRATNIDGNERGRDLYEDDDGDPQSGKTITGDDREVKIPRAPKGVTDLGYEHTHPAGPGGNLFSWEDFDNVRAGQRAYLISLDGEIQVFDRDSFSISVVRPPSVNPTQLPTRVPIGPR
jgi:hypothetical protein